MKQYIDLVETIMNEGEWRGDRTGTGTKSVFGAYIKHDCSKSFPLLTHKKVTPKSVFAELIWFMAGDTDARNLEKLGSTIWKEWKNDNDSIGPMYGAAWRGKQGHKVDQLAEALKLIKTEPNSRRILVSAWRPELLPDSRLTPTENVDVGRMALPPCHVQYQFYVSTTGTLNLKWDQRSWDVGLGAPFNIASYGALLYIMAYLTDLKPGNLIVSVGDAHLYADHINNGHVDEILSRELHELPTMDLSEINELNYARWKMRQLQKNAPTTAYAEVLDFISVTSAHEMVDGLKSSIKDYKHGPVIKMPVSV